MNVKTRFVKTKLKNFLVLLYYYYIHLINKSVLEMILIENFVYIIFIIFFLTIIIGCAFGERNKFKIITSHPYLYAHINNCA